MKYCYVRTGKHNRGVGWMIKRNMFESQCHPSGPKQNFLEPLCQMFIQSTPLTFSTSLSNIYEEHYKFLHDSLLQNIRVEALEQSGRENYHRGYSDTGFSWKWHPRAAGAKSDTSTWAYFGTDISLMFSIQTCDLCWLQWTIYLWTNFRSHCSFTPRERKFQCSEA